MALCVMTVVIILVIFYDNFHQYNADRIAENIERKRNLVQTNEHFFFNETFVQPASVFMQQNKNKTEEILNKVLVNIDNNNHNEIHTNYWRSKRQSPLSYNISGLEAANFFGQRKDPKSNMSETEWLYERAKQWNQYVDKRSKEFEQAEKEAKEKASRKPIPRPDKKPHVISFKNRPKPISNQQVSPLPSSINNNAVHRSNNNRQVVNNENDIINEYENEGTERQSTMTSLSRNKFFFQVQPIIPENEKKKKPMKETVYFFSEN